MSAARRIRVDERPRRRPVDPPAADDGPRVDCDALVLVGLVVDGHGCSTLPNSCILMYTLMETGTPMDFRYADLTELSSALSKRAISPANAT